MGCGASTPAPPVAYTLKENEPEDKWDDDDQMTELPESVSQQNSKKMPSWVMGCAAADEEADDLFKNRQSTRVSQRMSRKNDRASAFDADCSQAIKGLFDAVLDGEDMKLKGLLEFGVHVNTIDAEGNTPLILAAEGETNCVKLLVEHKAELEHVNNDGFTALLAAITYEDIGIVEILLAAGCEATEEATKLARSSGVPEIITAVTGESFKERRIDRESYRSKRTDTDIRVKSMSAKDVASFSSGFVDANAATPGFRRRQSLRMDMRNAHKEDSTKRRSVMAMEMPPGTGGELPPARVEGEELVDAVLDGDASRLKRLLSRGAKADYVDSDGNTPLIIACEGEAACVKELLTAQSPLEHRNSEGTSALMAAIIYEDIEIVKFLLLAGAEATDDAVKLAEESGVPDIIQEVTGEVTPQRQMDRDSYRGKRSDADIRINSMSGDDVKSFTHGYVLANASTAGPVAVESR